jgi:hypothetical protein
MVDLMPARSSPLSGDRHVERNSQETDGVLGTKIGHRKTVEYLG